MKVSVRAKVLLRRFKLQEVLVRFSDSRKVDWNKTDKLSIHTRQQSGRKAFFTVKPGSNPVQSAEWVCNAPAVETTTGTGRRVDIGYKEEAFMYSCFSSNSGSKHTASWLSRRREWAKTVLLWLSVIIWVFVVKTGFFVAINPKEKV